MNSIMSTVVKAQREKTPFSRRYIEFLQADLPKNVVEAVAFNIVVWQEKKGTLRTDRQFQYYSKALSKEMFEANEEVIMANKSDAKILEQMAQFRDENSLDMCPEGDAWFAYIINGGQRP